jgi:hypothetical protein
MAITLTREEAQQVLDALEWAERRYSFADLELFNKPIETLRARLAQPERKWHGLTDEEISELIRNTHNTGSFVRAIEAKLKEKNT